MRQNWLLTALLGLCGAITATPARAEPPASERDLGNEAHAVFATKCAACHGPDLVKPKGRFDYVLDLRRLASNPEMVIPGQVGESELWALVSHDEMPPPDSPRGPLSPAQKEIIRDWIAAGAPDVSPAKLDQLRGAAAELVESATVEQAPGDRLVRLLGKFHLLFLHFPIALFLAACIGQAISLWRRDPVPTEMVRFCLWLGALAAIPTATLGWLFAAAGNGAGSHQLLLAHRWLGIATTVWLVVTALVCERTVCRRTQSWTLTVLMIFGVLITVLTGHFGGLLVHGMDFFDY